MRLYKLFHAHDLFCVGRAARAGGLSSYPKYHRRRAQHALLFLFVLLLDACATPSEHFANSAKQYGFTEMTLQASHFQHKIYANTYHAADNASLHVYLDGDGSPLEEPGGDPTARHPMILSLMAQDISPAILLGRPCYHGLADTAPCHYGLWTSRRYAPEIVESMVDALTRWLQTRAFKKVVLIGYSGGGALAVLMANKIPAVQVIVTVAANLDVDAWTRQHHHAPLTGSLSPVLEAPLKSSIKQLHLAGGNDENVPPSIIKAYADKQYQADYLVYPDFTHQCCWEAKWPMILTLF